METFQRRDLTLLNLTLPRDIVEVIRHYHFEVTYINSESILSYWSQLPRKLPPMKLLKILAARIEKFLLSSKRQLRIQGVSGLHRFILHSSETYLKIMVSKLSRATNAPNFQCAVCLGCGENTSYYRCPCCYPNDTCYRCKGTGYSSGYYKYDVILTKR